MTSQDMHVIDRQTVVLRDPFDDEALILALGGGGEGTMGRLRGRQVVALDRRAGELREAPPGPIKVIGEATNLPFLDDAFDDVTAFFFLMYVAPSEQRAVLREARRVLRPGGRLYVWDVRIPENTGHAEPIFVVPLTIQFPDGTVETGYGTRWEGRTQDAASTRTLVEEAGFTLLSEEQTGETFYQEFERTADD